MTKHCMCTAFLLSFVGVTGTALANKTPMPHRPSQLSGTAVQVAPGTRNGVIRNYLNASMPIVGADDGEAQPESNGLRVDRVSGYLLMRTIYDYGGFAVNDCSGSDVQCGVEADYPTASELLADTDYWPTNDSHNGCSCFEAYPTPTAEPASSVAYEAAPDWVKVSLDSANHMADAADSIDECGYASWATECYVDYYNNMVLRPIRFSGSYSGKVALWAKLSLAGVYVPPDEATSISSYTSASIQYAYDTPPSMTGGASNCSGTLTSVARYNATTLYNEVAGENEWMPNYDSDWFELDPCMDINQTFSLGYRLSAHAHGAAPTQGCVWYFRVVPTDCQ